MSRFKVETARSRRFRCGDFVDIVEVGGGWELSGGCGGGTLSGSRRLYRGMSGVPFLAVNSRKDSAEFHGIPFKSP